MWWCLLKQTWKHKQEPEQSKYGWNLHTNQNWNPHEPPPWRPWTPVQLQSPEWTLKQHLQNEWWGALLLNKCSFCLTCWKLALRVPGPGDWLRSFGLVRASVAFISVKGTSVYICTSTKHCSLKLLPPVKPNVGSSSTVWSNSAQSIYNYFGKSTSKYSEDQIFKSIFNTSVWGTILPCCECQIVEHPLHVCTLRLSVCLSALRTGAVLFRPTIWTKMNEAQWTMTPEPSTNYLNVSLRFSSIQLHLREEILLSSEKQLDPKILSGV